MSIASPTYLCLATGWNRRKPGRESSMSGKGGKQRSDLAELPSLQVAQGQAWIGLTVDLSGFGYTGGAGSLRRQPRELGRRGLNTAPPSAPDTCPARVAKGRIRGLNATTCSTGNTGSPKLVETTSPIWRRSLHSIQCGSVMGLAAGIQSGPSHRHKPPAMAAKPGGVGEKGGSSWCGHPLPEGG